MQLKQIKLAGFKSFVDPVTMELRGRLVGVVGPNGCGKSNVVDAVRWVLGESSAKQLRSDAMAEVIFNGSSARKLVGQASVELVFDNSDGRIAGQYAAYTDIAVRRQVSRDGTSAYFLNGTRCRRRDITDIFLGTGLGPRSYAIIEQGMISRLIEARPEELRVFLEEAAGISRYKERRKETESRISQTRDNMARLDDLRDELQRQANLLQRQARSAERYREFMAEMRGLQGQLLAVRWRTLEQQAEGLRRGVGDKETRLEAARADLRADETMLEELRLQQQQAQRDMTAVQERYYAVGARIASDEQALAHGRQRVAEIGEEITGVRGEQTSLEQQLQRDTARATQLRDELTLLEPRLQQCDGDLLTSQQAHEQAVQRTASERAALDEARGQLAQAQRRQDLATDQVHRLEAAIAREAQQAQRLAEEQASLQQEDLQGALDLAVAALAEAQQQREAAQQALDRLDRIIADHQRTQQGLQHTLHDLRGELHEKRGRQGSLQALQEQLLDEAAPDLDALLEAAGWPQVERLLANLQVEDGWQQALEVVLGSRIGAVLSQDLETMEQRLADASGRQAGLVLVYWPPGDEQPVAPAATATSHRLTPLSAVVRGRAATLGLLAGVYCVPDLATAQACRGELSAHESVITPAGEWLGPDWSYLPGVAEQATEGPLRRQQALVTLSGEIDALAAREAALLEQLAATAREQEAASQERRRQGTLLQQSQQRVAELTAQKARVETHLERTRERLAHIASESERLARERATANNELAQAREALSSTNEALQLAEAAQSQARAGLDRALQAEAAAREQLDGQRRELQELRLRHGSASAEFESVQTSSRRWQEQLRGLAQRLAGLQQQLTSAEAPLAQLQSKLQASLGEREQAELELTGAREILNDVETRIRQAEAHRLQMQRGVEQAQQDLASAQGELQQVGARVESLAEQAREQDVVLSAVIETLPEAVTEAQLRDQIEGLQRRIERLGAINLAAIDEHRQVSERLTYLDSQRADLEEALGIMEQAIRKIDRETRGRFEATYNQVRTGVETLFPKLFGGGHATLELQDDDLLTAGVAVVARPPGKRNSSIHQLSGGEKALTAIALVFAIFELNPAPFCILDEVDAPLDDANVHRFCDLVREMSHRVQFLFITHNKTTMELAEQLSGVTMSEPGVSRLVAVDVDEAARLAEA